MITGKLLLEAFRFDELKICGDVSEKVIKEKSQTNAFAEAEVKWMDAKLATAITRK